MNNLGTRHAAVLAGACVLACVSGCIERRIYITSEPPGATVWVNDVEAGRTPTSVKFTYFGNYDVRLRKGGFEPLITKGSANPPVYEFPGPDLLASAVPARIKTDVKWHYVLAPKAESIGTQSEFESGLMKRASTLRAQIPPAIPTDAAASTTSDTK
ncbi:MAG: PEGA domain-containing protein [Planctomycetota bacterium]|nr:PEGA domain-containing protein [Planctomycetota bacterium]